MFAWHEEFIPIVKSNVPVKKKRYWEQIPYVLAPPPVPTTVQHEMKEKVQIRDVWVFGNCVPTCQQKTKMALGNFERLSQHGGRAEFSKNLCSSSCKKIKIT
jgi:hypothetical protein